MAATEAARNQPCPCGSGRKYKHCCQGRSSASDTARRYRLPLAITASVLIIAGILMALDFTQIGAAIMMGGLLVSILLAAGTGPSKAGTGDGSAIDFGRSGK